VANSLNKRTKALIVMKAALGIQSVSVVVVEWWK